MHRDHLIDAIKNGPIRISMNDGRTYTVRSPEFMLVDDIAAHVLPDELTDGKRIARILSLVCMTSIESLAPTE